MSGRELVDVGQKQCGLPLLSVFIVELAGLLQRGSCRNASTGMWQSKIRVSIRLPALTEN